MPPPPPPPGCQKDPMLTLERQGWDGSSNLTPDARHQLLAADAEERHRAERAPHRQSQIRRRAANNGGAEPNAR